MTKLVKLGAELIKEAPNPGLDIFSYSALLGKIVFAYRIRADLTQVQLAEQADITTKTVHRIEGGNNNITMATYEKVFNVLNITPEKLAEAIEEDAAKKAKWDQREMVTH